MESAEKFAHGCGGHSANVNIRLVMGEKIFEISQVGGGRITFSAPVMVPDTRGVLVIVIDGNLEFWSVAMKPTRQPTLEVEATFRLMSAVAGAASCDRMC